MVKKILFTIAVVAFLTGSVVEAVDPGKYKIKDDDMWPFEYVYVSICDDIKIYMDVGYFVQMEKCGDYKIKLTQVTCGDIDKSSTKDFPCYEACATIKVRANFDAKLSGDVISIVPYLIEDKTSVYYRDCEKDGCVPDIVVGDGTWHETKVCVRAWDVQIWNAEDDQGKQEAHVGYLSVTVKPVQG